MTTFIAAPSSPTAVTVVRFCALVQSAVAAVAAALCAALAIGSFAADQGAARAGHSDNWWGFGEFLGAAGATLAVAAGLLVAVPALRLERHRPAARAALIAGELVTGIPLLALLPFALTAENQPFAKAGALVWCAGAVVALVAAFRPTTRAWSAGR